MGTTNRAPDWKPNPCRTISGDTANDSRYKPLSLSPSSSRTCSRRKSSLLYLTRSKRHRQAEYVHPTPPLRPLTRFAPTIIPAAHHHALSYIPVSVCSLPRCLTLVLANGARKGASRASCFALHTDIVMAECTCSDGWVRVHTPSMMPVGVRRTNRYVGTSVGNVETKSQCGYAYHY